MQLPGLSENATDFGDVLQWNGASTGDHENLRAIKVTVVERVADVARTATEFIRDLAHRKKCHMFVSSVE